MVVGQSTSDTPDGYCAGCGARLSPPKGPGRKPKWCSERCRKASYGDPCVDCGARTSYGAEQARVPEPHCTPCKQRHDSDRRCERVLRMVELRRKGLTNKQIGERMNVPRLTVSVELCRMRSLGFDVPAADYNNVKLGAQPPKVMEEARVLGRELAKRGHVTPLRDRIAA